ncbi:CARD10 [Lepeophtheirus salmonis]|uniref:CARD10 n=1 Tax=Lepeophtheirus salmonis TaxID=72036 RepID=A0A7R8CSM1_LEPSM|nr:CARD10 [Lepeophtheirus salmonis]CAF2881948.1 CARD10 [Lepeophtheirus salmonis]
MVNLKRNDSHEQNVFDEKHRQINDLTDKNEKLNRTIKTLRDKDANQAKEIQRLKDENYELQNAEKSSTKPSGMSNIIKDRDSLRLKVRRLEQRLETINRPERPLEESSEDNGEEDAIEKRIKKRWRACSLE